MLRRAARRGASRARRAGRDRNACHPAPPATGSTTAPLAEIGGKGLFTKEIEEALLDGTHRSRGAFAEGLPTLLPRRPGHRRHLPREDPRDALLRARRRSLAALPQGAVGRHLVAAPPGAAPAAARPICASCRLRGNVDTRLTKLAAGEVDATLLARRRVEAPRPRRAHHRDPCRREEMLPAVAQGAIGIEIRAATMRASRRYLDAIDHAATASCVTAERALLAALDGSCRTPIAALAEIGADGCSRCAP